MSVTDLPIFQMLKTRMKWHNQRQGVLAENVANADTPNFKARDLKELKFEVPTSLGPLRTNSGHIGAGGVQGQANGQGDLFARRVPTFETTPSGNSVSLEDEMIKVGQNQQDFQTAATLYQKSLGLLRMAVARR